MKARLKSILCDLSNLDWVGVWNSNQSGYFGGKLEVKGERVKIESISGEKLHFTLDDVQKVSNDFEIIFSRCFSETSAARELFLNQIFKPKFK